MRLLMLACMLAAATRAGVTAGAGKPDRRKISILHLRYMILPSTVTTEMLLVTWQEPTSPRVNRVDPDDDDEFNDQEAYRYTDNDDLVYILQLSLLQLRFSYNGPSRRPRQLTPGTLGQQLS
ncbi:hypothetical protein V8F06_012547 [Rhypophila decipiens]